MIPQPPGAISEEVRALYFQIILVMHGVGVKFVSTDRFLIQGMAELIDRVAGARKQFAAGQIDGTALANVEAENMHVLRDLAQSCRVPDDALERLLAEAGEPEAG